MQSTNLCRNLAQMWTGSSFNQSPISWQTLSTSKLILLFLTPKLKLWNLGAGRAFTNHRLVLLASKHAADSLFSGLFAGAPLTRGVYFLLP